MKPDSQFARIEDSSAPSKLGRLTSVTILNDLRSTIQASKRKAMTHSVTPAGSSKLFYASPPSQTPGGSGFGHSIPFIVPRGPPGMCRVDAYGRPLVHDDINLDLAGGHYTSNPRGKMYPATYGSSNEHGQMYGTTSTNSPYMPRPSQFTVDNSRDQRPGSSSEPQV
jgi:hypothetical protein